MIDLKESDCLKMGAGARVFRHPNEPGSLIKITKPPAPKSFMWLRNLFEGRRRRFGAMYLSYIELEEYMLSVSRVGAVPPFMPEFRGVVQTTLGPGLVFEAIENRTGDLADSIAEYTQRCGLTDALKAALEVLFQQISNWRLVAWDLNPKNILVVPDENNQIKLVLVDGLGERAFIRVLSMSERALNRDLTAKHAQLLAMLAKSAT